MSEWGLGPRQQGGRPTCSVFVVATAVEFAEASRQRQGRRLSVEFLNWAANQVTGHAEDGAFFSDLWRGFVAHGVCVEEEMPYASQFRPQVQPSSDAVQAAKAMLERGLRLHWIKEWNVTNGLTGEQLVKIKSTLTRGWPVGGGLRWPKQERWEHGVLQMCPPEAVRDGHSVLLVGYRDGPSQLGGGVFMFRNTSGSGQDGSMPYGYARMYMNDAFWIDR
jgi:hypothetical protein